MAYPEFGDGYYYYFGDDYALFRWQVSRYNQEDYNIDFVIALRWWDEIEFYYNTEEMTQSSDWVAGVSYGDGVSYNISSLSGDMILEPEEVIHYEFEPFPYGEIRIGDDGLFSGTFMGVSDLYNPYQFRFVVTDSYGIYDEKTLDLWIATLDETENEIAETTKLGQNYPNPFVRREGSRGQETSINYELEMAGNVSLEIFNLKGQKVTTLVQEYLEAGKHQAGWNGLNSEGEAVSAGVYFYRLQSEGSSLSRKLLILK